MKKSILLSFLAFLSFAAVAQNSTKKIYVYKTDNNVDSILIENINKIEHSKYDINGNEQSDFVQMIIRTQDKVYHYLTKDLNKVTFKYSCPYIFSDVQTKSIKSCSAIITGLLNGLPTNFNNVKIGILFGKDNNLSTIKDTIFFANNVKDDGSFEIELCDLLSISFYYYKPFVLIGNTYYYDNRVYKFQTKVTEGRLIDLGINTYWDSKNIGAAETKEIGNYYAWGETKVKENYSLSTYFDDTYVIINKSKNSGEISGTKYDVAKELFGTLWRMPTKDDLDKLSELEHFATTYNDVGGTAFRGRNGNSIFIPDGYEMIGTGHSENRGPNYRLIWSGTLADKSEAYCLYLENYNTASNTEFRCFGLPIRPVVDNFNVITSNEDIMLIQTLYLKYIDNRTVTLNGAIYGLNSNYKSIKIGFVYGPDKNVNAESGQTLTNEVISGENYSDTINIPESKSHCRAYILIDDKYFYGESITLNPIKQPSNCKMVDLGLSVKWANMNVGANSEEEFGNEYAWGETESKTEFNSSNYFDSDYKLFNNSNKSTSFSESDYDAATIKWGGTWRTPTFDELKELKTKCTWSNDTINNVPGYKVTGSNSNSIFIPFNNYNGYWSSSLSTQNDRAARALWLNTNDFVLSNNYTRFDGHYIRPVSN